MNCAYLWIVNSNHQCNHNINEHILTIIRSNLSIFESCVFFDNVVLFVKLKSLFSNLWDNKFIIIIPSLITRTCLHPQHMHLLPHTIAIPRWLLIKAKRKKIVKYWIIKHVVHDKSMKKSWKSIKIPVNIWGEQWLALNTRVDGVSVWGCY